MAQTDPARATTTPAGPTHSRQRLPLAFTGPVALLSLTVLVHVVGRTAAVCHPHKVDSFIYAAAAHKLWHPEATVADLTSDKPPGQALWTGWCYRFAPGPPSRLSLVPIESAFLILSYAVFWLVALRLYGRRAAALLTLCFAIAHNTYNALDFTTDGFNLNESYLALPMLLAVLAHLTIASPLQRGFVRGIGLGVALSIKQSAVGLLVVFLLHGCMEAWIRKRAAQGTAAFVMTLLGLAAAWAPILLFLHAHGWLGEHVRSLLELTGTHARTMPFTMPRWYNISPMLPAVLWGTVGVFACVGLRRSGRADGVFDGTEDAAQRSGERHPLDASSGAIDHGGLPDGSDEMWADGGEPGRELPTPRSRVIVFLALWLGVELGILWTMKKPSSHYYQQIVASGTLLAGLGFTAFASMAARLRPDGRIVAWRWMGVTTAAVTVLAALPLFAEASRRLHTFDYQDEVKEFVRWIEPAPSALTPPG